MDLAARVDWVLKHRQELAPTPRGGWNLGTWSLLAGLNRTHLDTLLKRAAAGKNQQVQTMAKLAEAAKVSVCWFTFGIGSPDKTAQSAAAAARSMAKAMGYPPAFLTGWEPPAADLDADTTWTLIKADYQRWRLARAG